MQSILVPTDFSENSLKAALYAAEIAQRNGATVYFLHTMETGVDQILQPMSADDMHTRAQWEGKQAELELFRQGVTKVYGTVNTEIVLESGVPVESILDFCDFKKIGLVVMGTRGAGKIKQLLIGSVAAGVVSRSKIPVLVVPAEYAVEKPDGILFTTNHFEENTSLLEPIIELARLFGAKLHVVVFVDIDKAEALDYLESTRKLDHYREYLVKTYPGISLTCELAEGNHFDNTVELYHAQHDTDIAAMITYPRGFWNRIIHPSATKKMVYHSHIPVLAIPYSMKR